MDDVSVKVLKTSLFLTKLLNIFREVDYKRASRIFTSRTQFSQRDRKIADLADVESTRRLLEFLTRQKSPFTIPPDSCCIVLTDRCFLPNGHMVLSQHSVTRFFTFRLTSIYLSLYPVWGTTFTRYLRAASFRPFLLFSRNFRIAIHPLFAFVVFRIILSFSFVLALRTASNFFVKCRTNGVNRGLICLFIFF